MLHPVMNAIKLIVCIFLASAPVILLDVMAVQARMFFPATVSEIRESLEEAANNGESDIIVVLPGAYEINTVLRYNALDSEKHRNLFIGGLGNGLKPTLRRGDNADDSGLLRLGNSFGGDITVADIIFEGARSYGAGGALSISITGGNIGLINNYFRENETVGPGGGAHLINDRSGSIEVFNNIFEGNRAPGLWGGGLQIISVPTYHMPIEATDIGVVMLYNNTFINNEAFRGGGVYIKRRKPGSVLVYSNIFWGNTGDPADLFHELEDPGSRFVDFCTRIYYNQIGDFRFEPADSCFDTFRNSPLDPRLDGFVPRPGSPAIDSGPDPDGPLLALWIDPPVYDYRAYRRIVDGNGDGRAVIDRGAIEVGGPARGRPPFPFLPIRVIPDVPQSVGRLPSAPVKYLRISEVATNSDGRVGWTLSSQRSTSRTFALYYGDPRSGNYETGKAPNDGTLELPQMKFHKGDKPFLSFMLYMDTEQSTKVDTLRVYANRKLVWEKSPRTVRMRKWQLVEVDLRDYAGKTVELAVRFNTVNGSVNNSEGVYLDDLIISRNGRLPAKYSAPSIVKQGKGG